MAGVAQQGVRRRNRGSLALASQYLKDGGDAYMATMRRPGSINSQKNYDEASKHYANAARIQPGA